MKYSMHGVTQHDAPESMIACDISFAQVLLAMIIAILSYSIF
jgi:hypothetical protein